MPRRDGTGPAGVVRGTGRGRMGGPRSAGPEGFCVCPKCGNKVKHNRAEPCSTMKCPQCGEKMVRA